MTPFTVTSYIGCILAAGLVSYFSIPLIIKYTKQHGLVDIPGHRASHQSPTPTMGGIGIFIGLFIGIIGLFIISGIGISTLLSISILCILGIIDDQYDLSARLKFSIQFLVAFLWIYTSGHNIHYIHGILGLYELSPFISILLTTFIIVGVTNAYNLLDGIDGLAGGIGFINISILGVLFYLENNSNSLICFIAAITLLSFLRYNIHPAKIFMGDTGSLAIGFLMVSQTITWVEIDPVNTNNVLIAIGILILPVFDTLRLFLVRLLKGKSPFKADRNHIHHLLLKTGFNHFKASGLLYIANISIITTAFLIAKINININIKLLSILTIALGLIELLSIKRLLQKRNEISQRKKQLKKLLNTEQHLKKSSMFHSKIIL